TCLPWRATVQSPVQVLRVSPTIKGMLGPYISASSSPTDNPRSASASARFRLTVDLPTPPLPLATAITKRAGEEGLGRASSGRNFSAQDGGLNLAPSGRGFSVIRMMVLYYRRAGGLMSVGPEATLSIMGDLGGLVSSVIFTTMAVMLSAPPAS